MSLSRKILGFAALIGVVGLAAGTSAEAATTSKKKNQFAAFMSLPSTMISAQSAAGMITTQSTTPSALAQSTSLRAARGVAASASNTSAFGPLELRRFQILERAYLQQLRLLSRAEFSQERSLARQLLFGLITPTQYSTNLQGVIALYQTAKNDATSKFLAAATASQ